MKNNIMIALFLVLIALPVSATSSVSTSTSGNATAQASTQEVSTQSQSTQGSLDADTASTPGGNASSQASNGTQSITSTSTNGIPSSAGATSDQQAENQNIIQDFSALSTPIPAKLTIEPAKTPSVQTSATTTQSSQNSTEVLTGDVQRAYAALSLDVKDVKSEQAALVTKVSRIQVLMRWILVFLGIILLAQIVFLIIALINNRKNNTFIQL